MQKVWSRAIQDSGISGFPFTTTHLTGKSETFQSQSELNTRLKELGMTQRDDAAFLTKEYLGVDFRTGKQRYKESSGVGLPGCWV